jgi:ParB family chromosome partitioning protein
VASALNVREAEQRSESRTAKAPPKAEKDPDTKALEANLSNLLGLKVQVVDKGEAGGEVRIAYRELEQLDEICRRLSKN